MNNEEKELNNDTNNKSEKKKESLLKKILKMKKVLFIIIIVIVLGLGITFSTSVIKSQTKTTKLGLEDMGELVTQTAYLTIVQDTSEHREFFDLFEIPFTESRQIFSYDLEVDVSVDFSEISAEYNDKQKEITFKLPHAKIYKSTLNPDSLKVYLDSESLFSRIDLTEHNEAIKQMQEQGIKDAEANGILEAGDENAKRLLETFVKKDNKYKDYTINYTYI